MSHRSDQTSAANEFTQIHPIRETYLYYYAATSYEYLGRAAHIFSSAKIPLLTSALENFEAAYAALPATLPHAVLNSRQSYSPITDNPFSRSPSPQFDLSPLSPSGFIWSPTGSPTRQYNPVSDNEDASPSVRIWSPPTYSPVRPISPGVDAGALYQNTRPFQTPPPAPMLPNPSPSASSITTAFCITPPPAARGASRPCDAPIPVFDIPPPNRAPPPPPHGIFASPATSVGEQLVTFDSDKDGLPIGGNIVKNIARMIDNSFLTGSHDPFVSRERPSLRPAMRSPVRLSPIKFPSDLKDPVKQIKLIPSPLQIRKHSGEVLKCGGPGVVIRESSKQEDRGSKHEDDKDELKGPPLPIRVRPPRLPLRIIPSKHLNADTGKTKSPILSPQPKRVSPILPMAMPYPALSPSSMPPPPATPSPVLRKNIPVLGSPFTTPPRSPEVNSMSSYSSPSSSPEPVTPARAAEIIKFNNAVQWLREHIPTDISELRKQIQHVADFQKARRTRNTKMTRSASFWTFTPVKAKPGAESDVDSPLWDGPNIDEYGNLLRVETKAQRIKRLRKEGWRIGIRSKHSLWKGPEYYDELCETALGELGDGRGLTVEGNGYLREW